MANMLAVTAGAVVCAASVAHADIVLTSTVKGNTDIYLAGMPDGTIAAFVDLAPVNSPVLAHVGAISGLTFRFDATGSTNNEGDIPFHSPDGGTYWNHTTGAEHGISDVRAPINSLIGIFLDDNQPDLSPTVAGLSFDPVGGIGTDFLTLSPGLKQPFFIGDGWTSGAASQAFIAPAGATRLFLASWDAHNSLNNTGAFDVDITIVPAPAPAALALAAAAIAARRRRA